MSSLPPHFMDRNCFDKIWQTDTAALPSNHVLFLRPASFKKDMYIFIIAAMLSTNMCGVRLYYSPYIA